MSKEPAIPKMKTEKPKSKKPGLGISATPPFDFNMDKDTNFIHMKLIIAGGRDFSDFNLLTKEADAFISGRECLIISGGAKGADDLGERYAKLRGHQLKRVLAEWDKYGKSAGHKRNRVMGEQASHLLAFWDGTSKGTGGMIGIAKTLSLVTRVVGYSNSASRLPY